MSLSEKQIKASALEVANDIFGARNVEGLAMSAGPDWSGDLSYFLDFTVHQDRDRDVALDKRLRLRRTVMDLFATAGDDAYPYVRVLNRAVARPSD